MFELPALHYGYGDLEPYIDAQTMELHYSKHHQAYIDKLKAALDGTEWAERDLAEVLANLADLPEDKQLVVRNNGGGHYNHSLFWLMMTPGGATYEGEIARLIDGQFGNLTNFKEKFEAAAVGRFGSGWVWLVRDGVNLSIVSTPNQDNPVMEGVAATDILLALDVWEHAYYLKYQNRRPEYVQNWWQIVNWDFVNSRV